MSTVIDVLSKYLNEYTNNKYREADSNYVGEEYKPYLYDESIMIEHDNKFTGWDTLAKYPYYRLRGPQVTEEQAFEIIRRSDMAFTDMSDIRTNKAIVSEDIVYGVYDLWINWFMSERKVQGWCRPDGVIGANGTLYKYPELDEILDQLYILIKEFPFLDFVWAITDWDEIPLECKLDDSTFNAFVPNEEYSNFSDHIDIAFYVHDKKVEVLEGEKAKQKYNEYNKLYGGDEKIFTGSYYSGENNTPVDKEYLEKCINKYELSLCNIVFPHKLLV